jgi:hypothetical protein
MLFKNSARTPKRSPNFTITSINFLTLFKEIITVYSENHAKPINTKRSITDCQSRWLIYHNIYTHTHTHTHTHLYTYIYRSYRSALKVNLMIMITSMRWDYVSELRLPTGQLFIPRVIYGHRKPWWNFIDRENWFVGQSSLVILPAVIY